MMYRIWLIMECVLEDELGQCRPKRGCPSADSKRRERGFFAHAVIGKRAVAIGFDEATDSM